MYTETFTLHTFFLWLQAHQFPHMLADQPLVHKQPILSFYCQDHGQIKIMDKICLKGICHYFLILIWHVKSESCSSKISSNDKLVERVTSRRELSKNLIFNHSKSDTIVLECKHKC